MLLIAAEPTMHKPHQNMTPRIQTLLISTIFSTWYCESTLPNRALQYFERTALANRCSALI
jgi:hypothetical protein